MKPSQLLMTVGATLTACVVIAGAAGSAAAQEQPVAITGARIIPVTGDEIAKGTLVVQAGKIVAVGSSDAVQVPAGAQVIDGAGKTVMPGLVDTHSHIGGIAGADGSGPIQPDVRVMDSLNPFDSGFRRAVAGGLTCMNVMPGSGHLLSGQTVYLKPRRGAKKIDELFVDPGVVSGGLKMANGTNSIGQPPFSGTRAKSAALVRERFIKAQEYREKVAAAADDPSKAPARDIGLEALVEAIEGTRIVHHHTHRADDIITVLRLQREFGFRVVLHHVSEAWKVADEIAQAEKDSGGKVLGCSAIVVDSPGGKLEAANLALITGGILEKAGATVAFHTDDWITDSRLFLRSGAIAVRAGMSRRAALEALTIQGARMMDLQERVGSLEVGKDADFVVLSGDPFSVYTKVEQTWIDGAKVFDREDPEDRLYAVGGYGAGADTEPYLCCAEQAIFFAGKQWQTAAPASGGGQ